MAATASAMPTVGMLDELKTRLKATWMAGDYDLFARYMEKDSELFYKRLGIRPGSRVLDVGCGAGQLALIAARYGASVTGCDIAVNWLEQARVRAAAEGLDIAFEEGDAEALPYDDCHFDAVISFVGAMFAPHPDRVAAELTRVCAPGGRICMANWTADGFVGRMFRIIGRHLAPQGMPAPVLWGDEEVVRERFYGKGVVLKLARRTFHFEYPFAPEHVVEFFRKTYGPMARAFASLDESAQARLRRELVFLWSEYNLALNGGTCVESEYLEVVATRKP